MRNAEKPKYQAEFSYLMGISRKNEIQGNQVFGATDRFELGQTVEVIRGTYEGATGEVIKVTPTQVVFESPTGFRYHDVNPGVLYIK